MTVLSQSDNSPAMPQPFIITRAADLPTARWAGGTTTQLAIFPPHASFQQRNFDWRVSTATVEQSGPFTRLDGFKRTLMLLSGAGVKLDFAGGRREKLSEPFQQISFLGQDGVNCQLIGGKVVDFNVIYRPALNAWVEVCHGPAGANRQISGIKAVTVAYVLFGELTILQSIALPEQKAFRGDLAVIPCGCCREVVFSQQSAVILVRIKPEA